jgi:hypothetical protein
MGRENQPDIMPWSCGYTLVIDPTIFAEGLIFRFSCMLIDGSGNINLLYHATLENLGIPEVQLPPIRLNVHGIVPGLSFPMGKIKLDIFFGTKEIFCHESIWFEVVKLNIPYHALLGHPALSKFMAVLHYAYLKMKLSGPQGIITISDCYKHSLECTKASSKLAEALVSTEEKRQILQYIAMT